MNNLAVTLRDLGDVDGALKLQEQTLAGSRRVRGDDHPDTLASMKALSTIRKEFDEL
jgi:hypothetical protein